MADVRRRVVRCSQVHLPGALDGLQRQPQLRVARRARQLLDRVAIAVAAAEIHAPVDAGGIALQHLLHQADALEELAPIERADEPETGDQIGNRGLLDRLLLAVETDGILEGLAAS